MNDQRCHSAVLFVMFRRHDLAQQAIAAIRAARPPRLYLAADGPRPDQPGDAEACERTRAVVEAQLDWECRVERDYAAHNLGARARVSSAISWAFRSEERLIILEDDCVAGATFFRFCDELLERHATDERVAMISGNQFVPGGWSAADASYAYARLAQIWGWATWRRAWQHFDATLAGWPTDRREGLLARVFPNRRDRRYWTDRFDAPPEAGSWDDNWCYTRWRRGQLGIVPAVNLVSNLGFRPDASHTLAASHPAAAVPAATIAFPLRHPAEVSPDHALDEQTARLLFSTGGFAAWWKYQREQRLARWLGPLFGR